MSYEVEHVRESDLLPPALSRALRASLYRVLGLGLIALSAVGWLSLLTWAGNDGSQALGPTFLPQNVLGAPGALLADFGLQAIGLSAALLLFPPTFWGLDLIAGRALPGLRGRLAVWPIATLLAAGALASLPRPAFWPLEHGFGGLVGDLVFEALRVPFFSLGSTLATLASFAVLAAGAALGFAFTLGIGRPKQRFVPRSRSVSPASRERISQSAGPSIAGGVASLLRAGVDRLVAREEPSPVLRDTEPPALRSDDPPELPLGWDRMRSGDHEPIRPATTPVAPPKARSNGPAFSPYSAIADEDDDGEADPSLLGGVAGSTFTPVMEDQPEDEMSAAIARRFAPAGAKPAAAPADLAPMPDPDEPAPVLAKPRARSFGPVAPERPPGTFRLPSVRLLKKPVAAKPSPEFTQSVMRGNARLLEDVLNDFGIKGQIVDIRPGPVITVYELEPARGIKASRVIALADDIARSMSAASARIAVIPGRNAIGIELPNPRREAVGLRDLIESEGYRATGAQLPLVLGKATDGAPVITDLARMPHLLVAGTTGSGKSVGINAMILSLLFRMTPEQVKLILIDPKMLELSVYNGIPHLLAPVVTEPRKAVVALNWVVREMEERYKRMSLLNVRNIETYNNAIANAARQGRQPTRTVQTGFDRRSGQPIYVEEKLELSPMPFIVVVIDEMADLMMTAGKDIEAAVQRLAQMARAAGIHLITATQRPSVDVITGTIKANLPSRISFKVASKIDSRTILGDGGAEQLLGAGDMLYSAGGTQVSRVHGAFVSDEEVEQVVKDLRSQGRPAYIEAITAEPEEEMDEGEMGGEGGSGDDLYDRAVSIVLKDRKVSTSYIQRRLQIGYNRAADLIERMEQDGIISPPNGAGKRHILAGDGPAAKIAS
ncbi:MAG: DNA translocase FtsK 4TM domain-containing protein [Hyphomicrobiaceae bacterium]